VTAISADSLQSQSLKAVACTPRRIYICQHLFKSAESYCSAGGI